MATLHWHSMAVRTACLGDPFRMFNDDMSLLNESDWSRNNGPTDFFACLSQFHGSLREICQEHNFGKPISLSSVEDLGI